MTKRQAILAAIAGTIGLMGRRAKTEPIEGSNATNVFEQKPQSVWFDLNTYARFTFNLEGKEITITGREIFDALNQ